MPITRLAALFLLFPYATPPYAPVVRRADVEDAASLELAKRFDATVRFHPDGSGTLIGDRWVLTAAHVARGLSPFSPRVHVGDADRRVRRAFFHPDSTGDGRRPPRVDLALVELEEPVEGVRPARLYLRSDEVGRAVFVVGYGDFGPAGARLTRGDGRRRAATNIVDAAEEGRLVLDFDAPPDGTELEGVGGPGDSGGPLYLAPDEGELDAAPFLAGVSFASLGGRPGSYGVKDLYVRVSEFAAWVDATRKAAPAVPVERPDVIDVAGGFPEGPRGALLAAFFESFGEPESIASFAARWRSDASRRRSPDPAFLGRMARLADELGELEPQRLARIDDRRWVVLAQGSAGWHGVVFRFAPGPGEDDARLDDLGVRPEVPPAE